MAFFSTNNTRIAGIAAAVPKNEISNWDYEHLTDQEKKMLIKTIGVEKKRFAPKHITTSDLGYAASEKLIADLNWNKEDIQVLIFVSQSKDYFLPSTACILQDRLGLPHSTVAFDVGMGCSGYVYGLSIINSLMSASGLKKGLMIVGDNSLVTCNYRDKSSYPLFGDAATVTAIEYDADSSPFHYDLLTDGSRHKAIIIPHGGMRNQATKESFDEVEVSPGIFRSPLNTKLEGLDIFNFSISEVPLSINEFMNRTSTTPENYDAFVMHQANLIMNESIRKKLKFTTEQVPYTLSKFGNTSSASIPLTIVSELQDKITTEPMNFIISGFGVGLSWGVSSFRTNKIACPNIIELE
ncbi:MAG: ketoacyl-ACP synthase III [Bacteroidetes bacterium]|nr:ketoacyl-ACP synthase III [Bacteroidota bacterium]